MLLKEETVGVHGVEANERIDRLDQDVRSARKLWHEVVQDEGNERN